MAKTFVNLAAELLGGTAGAYGVNNLIVQAIPANRRCSLRRYQCDFTDSNAAGGAAIFRVIITDAVTAAVITGIASSMNTPQNVWITYAGDAMMFWNSGVNGCVLTASIAAQRVTGLVRCFGSLYEES